MKRVKANCFKLFNPGRHLSVDEAMVPFKGHSSLKQYMPKKPVKRGFKILVVAEATTGYFLDFNIYTGATGDSTEQGLATKVVESLTDVYQQQQRKHITPTATLGTRFPAKVNSTRCENCKLFGRTRWCCPGCPVKPSLCLTGRNDGSNCFVTWHNTH